MCGEGSREGGRGKGRRKGGKGEGNEGDKKIHTYIYLEHAVEPTISSSLGWHSTHYTTRELGRFVQATPCN